MARIIKRKKRNKLFFRESEALRKGGVYVLRKKGTLQSELESEEHRAMDRDRYAEIMAGLKTMDDPQKVRTFVARSTKNDWRYGRYYDAYLMMVRRSKYRPGAPSDGFGHIQLTAEELADPLRLEKEAAEYALKFLQEDDETEYPMGCPDGRVNIAFFLAIEAARVMCGGGDDHTRTIVRNILKAALAALDNEGDTSAR